MKRASISQRTERPICSLDWQCLSFTRRREEKGVNDFPQCSQTTVRCTLSLLVLRALQATGLSTSARRASCTASLALCISAQQGKGLTVVQSKTLLVTTAGVNLTTWAGRVSCQMARTRPRPQAQGAHLSPHTDATVWAQPAPRTHVGRALRSRPPESFPEGTEQHTAVLWAQRTLTANTAHILQGKLPLFF